MKLEILDDKQFVVDEENSWGLAFNDSLGGEKISAGSVLVWGVNRKDGKSKVPLAMFQLMDDIYFRILRPRLLLYYEEGSIVPYGDITVSKMGSPFWENCRFPTQKEYDVYKKQNTV